MFAKADRTSGQSPFLLLSPEEENKQKINWGLKCNVHCKYSEVYMYLYPLREHPEAEGQTISLPPPGNEPNSPASQAGILPKELSR